MKVISKQTFSGCTALAFISIPDNITDIDSTAFENCPNLGVIQIKKAENSIAGAPWGAENATVVWQ